MTTGRASALKTARADLPVRLYRALMRRATVNPVVLARWRLSKAPFSSTAAAKADDSTRWVLRLTLWLPLHKRTLNHRPANAGRFFYLAVR